MRSGDLQISAIQHLFRGALRPLPRALRYAPLTILGSVDLLPRVQQRVRGKGHRHHGHDPARRDNQQEEKYREHRRHV